MPAIAIQAQSEDEAFGIVMRWLATTLGALPIIDAVMIEPIEVTQIQEKVDTSNVYDIKKYKSK